MGVLSAFCAHRVPCGVSPPVPTFTFFVTWGSLSGVPFDFETF